MSEKTHCDVPIELSTYTLRCGAGGGKFSLHCQMSNNPFSGHLLPAVADRGGAARTAHEINGRKSVADSGFQLPSTIIIHPIPLRILIICASARARQPVTTPFRRPSISTLPASPLDLHLGPMWESASARVAAMRVPWFETSRAGRRAGTTAPGRQLSRPSPLAQQPGSV